jgi:hypothetical protein
MAEAVGVRGIRLEEPSQVDSPRSPKRSRTMDPFSWMRS